MKKLLTGLLALLMLVSSVFVLSSCGKKPELDLSDAEKALKGENYSVNYKTEKDIEAAEKLAGTGYEFRIGSRTVYSLGVEEYLEASNGNGDAIYIIKFAKSSTSKAFYKELKEDYEQGIEDAEIDLKVMKDYLSKYKKEMKNSEVDDFEDDIKEQKEYIKDLKDKKDYTFGRSGKYVWFGTPDAIKDTK